MPPREQPPQLVLASQSPRRTELLALTGLAFAQEYVQIDESRHAGEPATQYAIRLAREKAAAGAQLQNDGCLILAADTIVIHNDTILGKPANAEDADRMLRNLQGQSHTVITAIALARAGSGNSHTECCSTQVKLRQFSQQDRSDYIASGDPFDKAGGYGIQNHQFQPATTLGGCLANVMGLPLCHVVRVLSAVGVTLPSDVPGACTAHTGYDCSVHQIILAD